MGKYKHILLFLLFLLPVSLFSEETRDSVSVLKKQRKSTFLSIKGERGFVFPTNELVREENITNYSSLALKYGIMSRGDRWQDIAYGMPYFGIGLYTTTFHREELGNPISLYLIQGARIAALTKKITFHYEFNLGYSTNWNTYDPLDNPNNVAIGSENNVHVGANLYFKFLLNNRLDINVGGSLTHFSNGATRMPNRGMNLGSPYIEIAYKFNEPKEKIISDDLTPPEVNKRLDHDFLLTFSSRQIENNLYEPLAPKYIDNNFRILGFCYAPMIVSNYLFRWGAGVDVVYDESRGATSILTLNPADNRYYERVTLGEPKERFSVGFSGKGEIVMPHFSFIGGLGYNVLQGNEKDKRFYQILGMKIHFYENIFGTFGIRSTHFSKAQFFYWNVGYTIKGRNLEKK